VENQSISYEKVYDLWAFDTRYTESFFQYMERIMRGKKGIERDGKAIQGIVRSLEHSSIVPPA
jgi:hypothetical protein